MKLINQINKLKKSEVKEIVNTRLLEFKKLGQSNEWFSELCFCLLTANSKAITALRIQEQLGNNGFLNYSEEKVRQTIIDNHHRFHNNKTKFIIGARVYFNIKEIITSMNEFQARAWLAENIKGLGYKESSHFLRNVGYENVAILDRHILRLMNEYELIERLPNSLTKKKYLEIEEVFNNLAKELNMNSAELDLYMWYLKTGKVLK